MPDIEPITFFHAPQSRSTGTLTLLEELRAPYTLRVLNMKAGEQRQSAYLSINPLGKVPAIQHRGALVTEQVAICIYLADLFPGANLAPAITHPQRGPYLRWLVYYAATFEPALVDRSMGRDPAPQATSPYGTFDAMLRVLTDHLGTSPYLLGDTVSAADVLWAGALHWTMMFGLVPETRVIKDYVQRVTNRPSFTKVTAMDAQFAADHEAAVKSAQA